MPVPSGRDRAGAGRQQHRIRQQVARHITISGCGSLARKVLDLLKSVWARLETRDAIALGALVLASVSALISFSSRRLAGRSYRIALETNRRSQPSLDLYLIDGKMRPVVEPARRVCFLRLRITNQSDASNGIGELKLRVSCHKPDQLSTNFLVQHDHGLAIPADGVALGVPQAIGPRAVVAGVAVFPIPEPLIAGAYVDSHTVILTDSHGRQVEHEVLFLREERDAHRE